MVWTHAWYTCALCDEHAARHNILSALSLHVLQHVRAVQDLFTYLDIIVFVEATIYQMDEDNEKLCGHGGQEDEHILKGELVLHTTTGKLHLKVTTKFGHKSL